MTNSEAEVLIERKGSGLWITLNKPGTMNALTQDMLAGLKKALKSAAADLTLRTVVLTGRGKGFCVGADLADFNERAKAGKMLGFRSELDSNFHPVINGLRSLPQLVINRINGTCAGAGLAIGLAGDIKYAVKGTGFVGAFIKVGLAPDCGSSYLFAKALGYSKALELFLSRGKVAAEELAAFGLINRVFETSEAMDREIAELSTYVETLPPLALTLTKKTLRLAQEAPAFEAALTNEAAIQDYLGQTKDHAEGISAFLEKRKPVFTGN
ncbi:MAG: enoyl-CoA hydratase/isomerase family protein [Elusimicrobia bacterium]|nr:enoyl-CoA hydratase/isomerase family protein [Elusimicrobiota bacterium]